MAGFCQASTNSSSALSATSARASQRASVSVSVHALTGPDAVGDGDTALFRYLDHRLRLSFRPAFRAQPL
ncbi:hypothetical protein [[Kitasatospora] papulosa]|uniref:hypothetical protein n=1 Tax=[Kitasatospora] papulosa TaxID=1464011 RepID=UPI00380C2683